MSYNDKVLQYMIKQNRPYSVQNVFDNLHGDIPKAKLCLALDELVSDMVLRSFSALFKKGSHRTN